MNKRKLQQFLAWIHQVKTWQLVVILLISIIVSASFLRLNSQEMDKRRNAVYAADKLGDKPTIKKELVALQQFVSHHTNASLGKGFYLEHEYNRDRDAALAAATSATNPNAAVYKQASIECQNRFRGGVDSFRNDYVTCVSERVRALGPGGDPSDSLKLPRAENYHYNFVSPIWSPDFAGVSLAITLFITSVIILRLLAAFILRLLLKHRFKAI